MPLKNKLRRACNQLSKTDDEARRIIYVDISEVAGRPVLQLPTCLRDSIGHFLEPRMKLEEPKKLVDDARKLLSCRYEDLARILGVGRTSLFNYSSGKTTMPKSIYEKLVKIVGYRPKVTKILSARWSQQFASKIGAMSLKREAEEKAKRITSLLIKEKPILTAEFVGRMLANGTLKPRNEAWYSPHNLDGGRFLRMEHLCKELFGSKPKRYSTQMRLPSIAARVLVELGIPVGKKTHTNPHFPEFIMNGNKEVIKHAVRAYLDEEGYRAQSDIRVMCSVLVGGGQIAKLLRKKFGLEDGGIIYKGMLKEAKPLNIPKPNLLTDLQTLLLRLEIKINLMVQ